MQALQDALLANNKAQQMVLPGATALKLVACKTTLSNLAALHLAHKFIQNYQSRATHEQSMLRT